MKDRGGNTAQSKDVFERRVRDGALLLLIGMALFLCWVLAEPFLTALTSALALAVVVHPLQHWLERRLPASVAALVSVCAVVLVLAAPGSLLIQSIVDEAKTGLGPVAERMNSAYLHGLAARSELIGKAVDWIEGRFNLAGMISGIASLLASRSSALLSGSIQFVVQAAIALVALFYFLRDRQKLLGFVSRIIPLDPPEKTRLFLRISDTIRATIYGNLVVKLVQGVLGGVMFWVLGLPAPAICGIMMAFLAMVPVVGTSLLWGPAAIALLLQGAWVKAIVLALWGSLAISLVDNILYPILVADRMQLHTLGILIAVLGGLMTFGLAGLVLGPLIVACTAALIEMWSLRNRGLGEGLAYANPGPNNNLILRTKQEGSN